MVLDTNIILYHLAGDARLNKIIQGLSVAVSVITEIELRSYPTISLDEESLVVDYLEQVQIVELNSFIKENAIRIRRKYGLKLPDAIIYSTALYLKMPFFTADKGFAKIDSENIIIFSHLEE